MTLPGIFSYLYICAHEKDHQNAFNVTVNPVYTNSTSANASPPLTGDNDHVVDVWEDYHHMNSSSYDTSMPPLASAEAYGPTDGNGKLPNGDVPDDEIVADTGGDLGVIMGALADYSQDWAQGGVQYGKPYYLQPDPITKQAPDGSFYLWFTPAIGGNPSNLGTPYHVKALDDIRKNHPDLATYSNMIILNSADWSQFYNANPQ